MATQTPSPRRSERNTPRRPHTVLSTDSRKKRTKDFQNRQMACKFSMRSLDRSSLLELLDKAMDRYPLQMLHLMEEQGSSEDAGPPNANPPPWCKCGRCREMPTEPENVCCKEQDCLTLDPDFETVVLHEVNLTIARRNYRDKLVHNDLADRNQVLRRLAYRQYTEWKLGSLGKERRPIPSCCVWRVRERYPDKYGKYTGYAPIPEVRPLR